MKRVAGYDKDQNMADAMRLMDMLENLSTLPHPTIAVVHGPAYGGGVGLISACDMAVGVESAVFALSEVKLGLIPATISPYVIARIGAANARRFFLTGERFDARKVRQCVCEHEGGT